MKKNKSYFELTIQFFEKAGVEGGVASMSCSEVILYQRLAFIFAKNIALKFKKQQTF